MPTIGINKGEQYPCYSFYTDDTSGWREVIVSDEKLAELVAMQEVADKLHGELYELYYSVTKNPDGTA